MHGEAEALIQLALTLSQADPEAGRQTLNHLDHALRSARRLGTRPLECHVLNALGEVLLGAGRSEQALDQHAAALELARRTGERDEQARAHRGLARAHADLGNHDQAHDHLQEALGLYTALAAPEADQIRDQFATTPKPGA